jgi:hypothetical protein
MTKNEEKMIASVVSPLHFFKEAEALTAPRGETIVIGTDLNEMTETDYSFEKAWKENSLLYEDLLKARQTGEAANQLETSALENAYCNGIAEGSYVLFPNTPSKLVFNLCHAYEKKLKTSKLQLKTLEGMAKATDRIYHQSNAIFLESIRWELEEVDIFISSWHHLLDEQLSRTYATLFRTYASKFTSLLDQFPHAKLSFHLKKRLNACLNCCIVAEARNEYLTYNPSMAKALHILRKSLQEVRHRIVKLPHRNGERKSRH